ncbi:MAG TPA: autotransporter outer membrane beta-barrel domain-containing protein, partial [Candidatus Spyradosoma merdigallinarum]|nr:autotransporter outer membrane beta-barrel domain-containing protein [Candidatus Spyradosoma merdigallinarum]
FAGIDAGAGTVTLNGSLFVDNLNESTRGKTLTLVSAESISRKGGYTGIYAVVKALRDTNEEMADEADWMKLVVDVAADGSITAKMTTDNFSATGADYGAGVSDSFLSALSWLSSGGSYGAFGIVNMAEALEKDPQQYALMNALSGLSSDQLADEVEKLSPSGFASMLAMPVEAFNADVARIHARLDQRRYDGANPLRETGEYEFFVLAQGDVAENGSGADNPVFDYNLYGATAGVDWKPDYRSTLGLAFGYTYGKAKMRNGGGKVEMDDMRVTAFASRLIGDRFYVDGGLQAGTAMFDTRRETVAGSATGDTDAFFAGGFVTFGAVFTLSEDKKDGSGLYLMPNIGLSYLHESIDGFRESGTAGLDMDDADGDSLRARLAVALQWAFPFETWQVRLGVEAAYAHDFLGEDIDLDGRFTAGGNAFGTTAAALPTDVFSIGPTLDVGLTERDSLWLGYELEIDTDSGVSHGFNAGYRHRF